MKPEKNLLEPPAATQPIQREQDPSPLETEAEAGPSDSIQFDDDLSSVCMKSEASFFSRLPGPTSPKKELENQSELDIELVGDADEKQGLIEESEDEDDESSFKRRHKRNKKKKKFDDQCFTNQGNADQVHIEVVKRGRAKKVKVVSKEPRQLTQGSSNVQSWSVGTETRDSRMGPSLNESDAEFLHKPSRFLESGDHDFTLLNVNFFGCLFYWILCVTSFGIVFLLDFNFEWRFYNLLKWKFVQKVDQARGVLVRGEHGKQEYLQLGQESICLRHSEAPSLEVVVYKNEAKYYFDRETKSFRNVRETIYKTPVNELVEKNKRGLKHSNIDKLRQTFGPNVLNFASRFSLTTSIFQMYNFLILGYTLALCHFGHSVYAFVLLCFFMVSVTRTLLRKKRKEQMIRNHFEIKEKVMVLRRSDEGINIKNIINSEELVPFDVVEVSNQSRVPADMVIIHGRCLVSSGRNSHMRSAIPSSRNCDLDSLEDVHFLRAGEKVNLTINNVNEGVFAMVVGTGLGTLQGFELRKLLASIGRKNRYVSQVQTFIKRNSVFVLALASLVLLTEIFVFRSKKYIQFGRGIYDNTLRVFEISLVLLKPVALLLMKYVDDLGVLRLAQTEVHVNQLNTFANQLQNVRTVLMEDSNLSKGKNTVGGFLLTKQNPDDQFCLFKKPVKKSDHLLDQLQAHSDENLKRFLMALGCCNNSAQVNNIVYGSKQDSVLIRASRFEIQFEESTSEKLRRVFSLAQPELKLTETRVIESDQANPLFSVLVKDQSEAQYLLTKGDPVNVKTVCTGESIPLDFEDTLRKYSNKGFRVLALCAKDISSSVSESSAKNMLRGHLESQMVFLGLVLFKKKVNSKSETLVKELRSEGVEVKMMSSQNMHDCLNTASHSGLFAGRLTPKKDTLNLSQNNQKSSTTPLIVGTTVTRNKVEKLAFREYKIKGENHLEPREKSTLDLTSPDFIKSQNIELCLTGRAFELLVSDDSISLLKAIISKTRVYAELGLSQREAIINASVGVQGPFEKTLYVQTELEYERGKNHSSTEYKRENVFNDLRRDSVEENFSRNADLSVNVAFFRDLNQELTSNCSLNGDLLGLARLVSQGKDLAALNRQLVDFLLFAVWVQLLGLFLLYSRGVSLTKTEFFFLDILFVFGPATLLSMSIRHQKRKKRVRGSLLISSSELDRFEQKASDKIRKSNLIGSCLLGALVLYTCMSVLWRQASYSSPSKINKTESAQAKLNLYPDAFVVFSTLCWLNLCYFFLNVFSPVQYKTVQKYRALLYSLGLLGLLVYFQALTISDSPGPVNRVLRIPYLGLFAIKQIAIILAGFLVLMVVARLVTSMLVNKAMVKQIQLKETRILENHIQKSQNLEDLRKIKSGGFADSKTESPVMNKLRKLDLEKLEKESRKTQQRIEQKEQKKVYRFVMKEGEDISVELI